MRFAENYASRHVRFPGVICWDYLVINASRPSGLKSNIAVKAKDRLRECWISAGPGRCKCSYLADCREAIREGGLQINCSTGE